MFFYIHKFKDWTSDPNSTNYSVFTINLVQKNLVLFDYYIFNPNSTTIKPLNTKLMSSIIQWRVQF